MKQKLVNGRWMIWTTDEVADWDGGTGDPVAKRGWEYERFQSFRENLTWDDVFFDVGTEHGWIAGVLAQEFVDRARMHLFEPSPEFWPNIREVWFRNLEWYGLGDGDESVRGDAEQRQSDSQGHRCCDYPVCSMATT